MSVERFAPSPTGLLHLGHAFSALTAYEAAHAAGGRFLVRIEDIDGPRCKPQFVEAIREDLEWLGVQWEQPELFQSHRMQAYTAAVEQLTARGLTYSCHCTRKDIAAALSAPQEGAEGVFGPDGVVYPGTCRGRAGNADGAAIRLDMRKALASLSSADLGYQEIGENAGWNALDPDYLIDRCGDVVLARKDIGTSYHIAVVVDDAFQGISHVTRGVDMAPATNIHVVLQALLGLPTPIYRHHRLIRDATGKRLAKRHDALAIRKMRADGMSTIDVRNAAMQSA